MRKTVMMIVLSALARLCPGLAGPVRAEEPARGPVLGPVAVIEYRNAVKQVADLSANLASALSRNTSLQVIDQREGRRRIGARLDAEVAACGGEVKCLSAIGARLSAGEVLLVAVSQLGDVVLALQRIDVEGKAVSARVADSIAAGQVVDEARILGWLQQLYPPEMFKRYGQIRIKTDVEGAQVYVNAKARGKTPLREPLQVLAPGNYRLLVEKAQFLPFQASLSVMPDSTVEVAAPLTREAAPNPWYKRWYVWAAVGAVAVAGVSAVAIYYGAFNQPAPDMTKVPGSIEVR